jgi:hypothetical protein
MCIPEQRNVIASKLRDSTAGPAILAGDMNVSPDESLVCQFESEGFRTAQNEEITWRRMPFVTDHVFYNAPLRLLAKRVAKTDALRPPRGRGGFRVLLSFGCGRVGPLNFCDTRGLQTGVSGRGFFECVVGSPEEGGLVVQDDKHRHVFHQRGEAAFVIEGVKKRNALDVAAEVLPVCHRR